MAGKLFSFVDKAVDRFGYWWGAYGVIGGSTLIGLIASWVSAYSEWVGSFGAIGYFMTGLVAALFAALILLTIAWFRLAWGRASAMRKWMESVDQINPLDSEFSKARIRVADIADPVTNQISGKHFSNCDILGPANIYLLPGVSFVGVHFLDCMIVPVKSGVTVSARNVVGVGDSTFNRGRVSNVVIFVTEEALPVLAEFRDNFVAYTKDEVAPNPPQKGIGEETPR